MEDISIFFKPVEASLCSSTDETIGARALIHTENNFPDLTRKGVALIFVPEYRQSRSLSNQSSIKNDEFRTSFFKLYDHFESDFEIYDLGSIYPGDSYKDTTTALTNSTEYLIKKNIVPIVIGGSQDLTFSIYEAYKNLELLINLTTLDQEFDLGDKEVDLKENGWLSHILMDKACYLFNYSNLAAQGHYIPSSQFKLFEELYFDVNRLGQVSEDIKTVEPVLRNSDFLSFDLNAIRNADFSASTLDLVNGISSSEACKIARYAGISDKLSCFGIFNLDTIKLNDVSSDLLAQLIWYFIDGYSNRKGDFPKGSKKNYKKFRVNNEELDNELIFYKSHKSARWWMEVPYPGAKESKFQRHQLVPCNYLDYELAMKGELPDLWWKTYQKLSV